MIECGVVILGEDPGIASHALRAGLGVVLRDEPCVPWPKTLLATAQANIAWELLPSAWHFLRRWDAAVPLWRYDKTAMDIGSVDERRATEREVRDLRVLLYSYECLFVRQNVIGQTLIETWRDEMNRSEDRRLAFLRAVYRIKPRLCVLPANWCPPRLDDIGGEAEAASVKVPRNQVYWSRIRNRKG